MLIWHINYDKMSWANNMVNTSDPMRVDLIEADGKADGYSIANDAFPTNRVNSFDGFVTWNGDSLGLEIYDMQIVGDSMTFKTRGSRVAPELPSSSSKAVSSSSIKSSSSISSSSKVASSSSMKVLSSSATQSSSATAVSSSSNIFSSSTILNSSSSLSLLNSSSSDQFQTLSKINATTAASFQVADGILRVTANIEGRKAVNLFDANGTLLMTSSFNDRTCKVQLSKLRGKSFVVATLNVNGHLVKTQKIRVGY